MYRLETKQEKRQNYQTYLGNISSKNILNNIIENSVKNPSYVCGTRK